jgi:ABC-type multidrug transport system permease subunit
MAWSYGVPGLLSMVFCFAASAEFAAIVREVQANTYRLSSCLIAQAVLQLPLVILISLIATLPSGFGIGNWNFNAFWEMELLMIAFLLVYESLAQLLAVVSPHPALATMGVTSFWLVAFLFGGALIRKEDVPWPFRIFAFISPYFYTLKAASHSEFIHNTFTGAERNSDGSYTCPNELRVSCFGITGEEVLNSMSQIVYNISPENEFWNDLAIVVAMAIVFKLLFVLAAYFKCSFGMVISIPPSKDTGDGDTDMETREEHHTSTEV